MHNFKTLPKMINRITHFAQIRIILNKLFQKQGKVRKVGRALTGKKADSSGKFLEKKLIFLLAFIFMICLANLITILFLINIFL
jgi:hypothetical protein